MRIKVKAEGAAVKEASFDQFPVVFGRSSDCHLTLADFDILSRVHGSINLDHGQIVVWDFQSSNGIYQDGKRVPVIRFDKGGVFQVGDLDFELILENEQTQTEIDEVTEVENVSPVVKTPQTPEAAKAPKAPKATKPQMVSKAKTQARSQAPAAPSPVATSSQMDRLGVTLRPDPRVAKLAADGLCVQGVITWGGDVFDVRNFYANDPIRIGPHPTEPIFLPTFLHNVIYGRVLGGAAQLVLPARSKWQLVQDGQVIKGSGGAASSPAPVKLRLEKDQVLSVDLGHELELHLRYVEVPRPFVRKSLIENKEEIKRATKISGLIHMAVMSALLFMAPKHQAPKVENVPPRFAKLLVEPPKQIFVAKEEPKPPPPPPKPEPKPEPIKPVAKKKPMMPPSRRTAKSPQPTSRPEPSQQEQLADSFAEAFAMPTATKLNVSDVKVSRTNTPAGLSPTNIMKTISSSNGRLPTSSGGTSISGQVGNVGLKTGGMGTAGTQGVRATVVGKPSFSGGSGVQGLTQKEIMAVVNRHVASIQQCYERALLDNPGLAGRVEFEWMISAGGSVDTAKVKRSDVTGGGVLTNCVIGVIKSMRFPAAKNGHSTIATIGFPFGRN